MRWAMWLLTSVCIAVGITHRNASAQELSAPIQASGDKVYRWTIGDSQASLLEGECQLHQGNRRISARSILLVSDGPRGKVRTRVVIDGLQRADGSQRAEPTVTILESINDPEINSPNFGGVPASKPALLQFLPPDSQSDANPADKSVQQVQFTQNQSIPAPVLNSPLSDISSVPQPMTFSDGATTGVNQFFVDGGRQAISILSRNTSTLQQYSTINRPETGESVVIARGGVTAQIQDVAAQFDGQVIQLGSISLSADRIVAWVPLLTNIFSGDVDFSQSQGELYLEGDIVFRQGDRIIYAERMYFNVAQRKGVILDAEAITTIPNYQGIVRLKADVMQQVAQGNIIAFDAAVTTSRLGIPRYWLQSEQLSLTQKARIGTDPITGRPTTESEPFASSRNNFVYMAGVPILYWPRFSASLTEPTLYLSGVNYKNDRIFGNQVLLNWDLFQLLGIQNAPKGVDWDLSTDYLSDRGFGVGTTLKYRLPGLFGVSGPVNGVFDTWVIDDDGLDRLGGDRIDLQPETSFRGRSFFRHRHYLPNDFEFAAEVGWISDRNFLEQYIEREWDRDSDHNTGLRLRKYFRNQAFDLAANVQINEFFSETENLPSLDHYLLGGSFLGDWLTLSSHNRVAYTKLNVADAPTDPIQAANNFPLPGEADREGVVASTKHEVALPVAAGPFKFVPFLSGEAAYYEEDIAGNSLTRLLGQAGLRASLPMTRVDPTIQSNLLNVRGLAHKVEWTAEYFYADSDTDLDELPLYDSLDDNAQEQFRRRFIGSTFGGVLPAQFDPRTYAFRQGLQRSVTTPGQEIADDLQQFRLGVHQRFQTKRGLPGQERIVDLFQLDIDTILFPDADRDNFGETVGPTTYEMRYHIGDRFTILSDGYFDFFDDGLRSVSAGVRTSRPGRGDWFIGLLSLEGPISSTVVFSSVDYRINDKWILSGTNTYDFGSAGNIGQAYGLTRIGESFLVRLGVNVDSGRDNVSTGFSIEPRFWPSRRLGRLGGALIPPPGAEGLE